MQEYTVLIEETSAREVTVQAKDADEAHQIASKLWEKEEVVLGSEDFQGVFIAVQE